MASDSVGRSVSSFSLADRFTGTRSPIGCRASHQPIRARRSRFFISPSRTASFQNLVRSDFGFFSFGCLLSISGGSLREILPGGAAVCGADAGGLSRPAGDAQRRRQSAQPRRLPLFPLRPRRQVSFSVSIRVPKFVSSRPAHLVTAPGAVNELAFVTERFFNNPRASLFNDVY